MWGKLGGWGRPQAKRDDQDQNSKTTSPKQQRLLRLTAAPGRFRQLAFTLSTVHRICEERCPYRSPSPHF